MLSVIESVYLNLRVTHLCFLKKNFVIGWFLSDEQLSLPMRFLNSQNGILLTSSSRMQLSQVFPSVGGQQKGERDCSTLTNLQYLIVQTER